MVIPFGEYRLRIELRPANRYWWMTTRTDLGWGRALTLWIGPVVLTAWNNRIGGDVMSTWWTAETRDLPVPEPILQPPLPRFQRRT